jgi:8-oxo-dGTP diphosphatase
MNETTLCVLVQGRPPQKVLLGLKPRGFGAGKYTGFGGKIKAGETAAVAAIREVAEETRVQIHKDDLQPMGQLTFLFPFRPAWSQVVYLFLAGRWQGDPTEGEKIKPTWFSLEDIPFDEMWQDGAHWLPRILSGEQIQARFVFGEDNETLRQVTIQAWNSGS